MGFNHYALHPFYIFATIHNDSLSAEKVLLGNCCIGNVCANAIAEYR